LIELVGIPFQNTVALCPNCHRKMHNLNLVKDIELLKNIIQNEI